MSITNSRLEEIISGDAGIRAMFNLARQFETEGKKPIDLSLGNPDIKPPNEYHEVSISVINKSRSSGKNEHGYMPNQGYGKTRERVASDLEKRFSVPFTLDDIFMTAGCTNALNVTLASLIEPDKKYEIVTIAPFFPEYKNYIKNNSGTQIVVHTDSNFNLDLVAIEKKLTRRTAAIILNSPNNPSGAIYSKDSIVELSQILEEKNKEFKTTIAVIEDSPYDLLVFDNNEYNPILPHYSHTIYANSFSKSIGIAGERIGYMAVHPRIGDNGEDRKRFLRGMTVNLRSRIVSANATQQKIIEKIGCNLKVDVGKYESRINILSRILEKSGFNLVMPKGAFYLFPEIPSKFENEEEFRKYSHQGNDPLLYTPGIAFGGEKYKRHIRISVSVPYEEIVRACVKFKEICNKYEKGE